MNKLNDTVKTLAQMYQKLHKLSSFVYLCKKDKINCNCKLTWAILYDIIRRRESDISSGL